MTEERTPECEACGNEYDPEWGNAGNCYNCAVDWSKTK